MTVTLRHGTFRFKLHVADFVLCFFFCPALPCCAVICHHHAMLYHDLCDAVDCDVAMLCHDLCRAVTCHAFAMLCCAVYYDVTDVVVVLYFRLLPCCVMLLMLILLMLYHALCYTVDDVADAVFSPNPAMLSHTLCRAALSPYAIL